MNSTTLQASRSIAPRELHRLRQSGGSCEVLDVRTPPEYAVAHVAGAKLVPLDTLDPRAVVAQCADSTAPIYVLCQSGARAARAIDKFNAAGIDHCVLVEGGTQAWIDAGLPVERGTSKVLPLMRQVQIFVGLFSTLGSGLAIGVNPLFAIVPLILSGGLLFAGLSGTCGLALLLAQMPWNRQPTPANGATCCQP